VLGGGLPGCGMDGGAGLVHGPAGCGSLIRESARERDEKRDGDGETERQTENRAVEWWWGVIAGPDDRQLVLLLVRVILEVISNIASKVLKGRVACQMVPQSVFGDGDHHAGGLWRGDASFLDCTVSVGLPFSAPFLAPRIDSPLKFHTAAFLFVWHASIAKPMVGPLRILRGKRNCSPAGLFQTVIATRAISLAVCSELAIQRPSDAKRPALPERLSS
jgi:hypothetical protein